MDNEQRRSFDQEVKEKYKGKSLNCLLAKLNEAAAKVPEGAHKSLLIIATEELKKSMHIVALDKIEKSMETQIMDFNKIHMDQMVQAAEDSSWIPKEYSRSDWVADVCQFLRKGHNTAMHATSLFERGSAGNV